ncbi:hypothetical protein F9C07_1840295 [Aspergillus flavus]|uniref:Uncharacterized protein n=1 Tax=Aspergillus flavus (strain ATCC 200026 / FGSC A1120 / IAM 13836 / NRRL 3357 / JCM 12722 / SRRC 167) TaxID=332952 RepID=A0A7G5JPH7_ASPFN|nr:uncharacterized protein G4B84_010469 [Aspergillus flavus NRRL3357]QMW37519.1 hypothetical protein G4B11_000755 [Aspergillus flavus]KAF7623887.1 hypothetical protein AFLA_007607 [Aspergillus flavus NRRL3357]QMW34978.1 hypothetical protein G4B84_010469 [Aspergillus flavus NRRL3357]QRD91328.1 hypothetical protein F9C07_1840295 [Aspergillus flavus]RAQ61821.1 hypothetical protein COH20_010124 [Aspergillus flavus]
MSVIAFPIEAFRPWKPSQPKPIPRRRPPRAHHHKAPVPGRSSPALPNALNTLAPLHSLHSQQNNHQHPLPARPPAEVCVHGNLRSDICQSACSASGEEPVSTSGGSNELSVTELDESPVVTAMHAATSPQAQTRCGSPASDLNRLSDSVTTDISIESECSIQGVAGCRSLSENPASSTPQPPGLHEQALVPIDPVILSDEFRLESNQLYQDIGESDALWTSQQELPCLYPEPPIVPHSIFDNDHLSLRLTNENGPATHRHCGAHSRQALPDHSAESNAPSRDTRQQHCNSDINRAELHKRPSAGSDERKGRRNKRQRLEETTPSPAGSSCASLRFHFLSAPTTARLEFLSWLFEGALPRCTFEPEISSNIAPAKSTDGTRVRKQVRCATPQDADSLDNSNTREKSRKGMPWLPEEEDFLIDLRNTRGLPWSDVMKLFSDQYPGRSQGSVQVHWSTKLKKRCP